MADNFGLRIGVEGEKEFKNALRDINNSFKVLGSEMILVESQFDKNENSIQSLTSKNEVLNKQIDTQKDKIEILRKALENAANSFGENDRRTMQWQTQLNNATADLNKMERELKANEGAIDKMSSALDEGADNADNLGDSIKKSADIVDDAKEKFEGLGSVVKGVGLAIGAAVVAIGAAAVRAGTSLVELGNDYNKSINQISASTGATGSELEQLGEIAKNVYTHNFGDSLEDVAEGLSVVRKTTGLVGGDLEKAAESGFALRDTFGYDMRESVRAASALIKNFGISAWEAYNIIAVGAQNGADQNGDLLDTLNEYSTQYSALGLSADQFINGLISGAKAGVFSIDKVGDAVKEFNIRAKDGSSGTIEAFNALGMNSDEMMKRFAAGGDSAQNAFFEVVNALNGMEDPMAKNTAAVALFGTMYEDLEANVLPVLASMEDSSGIVQDALSQINEVRYADLGSALEGTKRSIQGVFLPAVGEMSAGITDAFSNLSNRINEADGDFEQISVAIGDTLGEITSIITGQLPMFIDLGLNIITSIGGAIIDNLPLIIDAAVEIVMTLLKELIDAVPLITDGALQLVLTLVQGIIDNLPAIIEAAIQMIVTLAMGIAEALPELIPSIVEAIILICQVLLDNMDKILEVAFALVQGLAEGLLAALPELVEALPQIISTMIDFFIKNYSTIVELGIQLTIQLAAGLIRAIPQLAAALPQIIAAIVEGLGNAVGSVFEIGKNIVSGLWEGIKSLGGWIKDKVSGFFSGIVDNANNLLGIHSPSTVFAGIGENMGKGIGVGFEQVMDEVAKDMQKSIPTDFAIDSSLNMNQNAYGLGTDSNTRSIVEHTGIIEVRGINNSNELTSVVEIIMDQFRREVRI